MTSGEAKALIGRLVAVFRPRDWGVAAEHEYTSAILEFPPDAAVEAIDWIIRDGSEFMPTPVKLRDAIRERERLHPKPALAAESTWTPEDERAAKQVAAKVLADWKARHTDRPHPRSFADLVAKEKP